jgi:hypothetical protein
MQKSVSQLHEVIFTRRCLERLNKLEVEHLITSDRSQRRRSQCIVQSELDLNKGLKERGFDDKVISFSIRPGCIYKKLVLDDAV